MSLPMLGPLGSDIRMPRPVQDRHGSALPPIATNEQTQLGATEGGARQLHRLLACARVAGGDRVHLCEVIRVIHETHRSETLACHRQWVDPARRWARTTGTRAA